MCAASANHTYGTGRVLLPEEPALSPSQRTGLLAKKWRNERNFWIAAFTFYMWG